MKVLGGYRVLTLGLLVVALVIAGFNSIGKNSVAVGFATNSQRFSREAVPSVALSNHWKATAWKGEKVHQQILVWSEGGLPALRIAKINALKNRRGHIIEARHLQAGFVGYVITDEYGDKVSSCKNDRRGQQFDSSWVADPIYRQQQMAAQRHKVQPIWISVSVPATAAAGTYTGTITVTPRGAGRTTPSNPSSLIVWRGRCGSSGNYFTHYHSSAGQNLAATGSMELSPRLVAAPGSYCARSKVAFVEQGTF